MGHTYAEMFPDEVERKNKITRKWESIFDRCKDKKLGEFTVSQLLLILELMEVKTSRLGFHTSEIALEQIESGLFEKEVTQ